MNQWSSRRLTVLILLTFLVGTLALLTAPLAAQYAGGRLREPADVMFLAGRGATLGLTVRDVDNPEKQSGVVVEDVVPEGAADKAGIKRADVITAFEGEAVRSLPLVHDAPSTTSVTPLLPLGDGLLFDERPAPHY